MHNTLSRFGRYMNKPQRAAQVFMLPSGILLTIFVFIPLVATFVMGLFDMNIFFTNTRFAGIENFTRLFADKRAINGLWHTLYFCLWQVAPQIIIGLVLAAALSKNNFFNKMCRTIFFIPVVCSLTSASIIWKMLLDHNIGYIPHLLSLMGVESPNFLGRAAYAMPTVAVTTVWKNFGMTLMILLSGIHAISASLYESAEIDGANKMQQFFEITIPQIMPSLGFCVLTNFIGSMQIFDQVYIMTGGGPQFKTETAVQYIYTRGFHSPYELGYASAISTVLFVIVAVISFALNRYLNKKEAQYS